MSDDAGRAALLGQIQSGKKLKHTQTNDRSSAMSSKSSPAPGGGPGGPGGAPGGPAGARKPGAGGGAGMGFVLPPADQLRAGLRPTPKTRDAGPQGSPSARPSPSPATALRPVSREQPPSAAGVHVVVTKKETVAAVVPRPAQQQSTRPAAGQQPAGARTSTVAVAHVSVAPAQGRESQAAPCSPNAAPRAAARPSAPQQAQRAEAKPSPAAISELDDLISQISKSSPPPTQRSEPPKEARVAVEVSYKPSEPQQQAASEPHKERAGVAVEVSFGKPSSPPPAASESRAPGPQEQTAHMSVEFSCKPAVASAQEGSKRASADAKTAKVDRLDSLLDDLDSFARGEATVVRSVPPPEPVAQPVLVASPQLRPASAASPDPHASVKPQTCAKPAVAPPASQFVRVDLGPLPVAKSQCSVTTQGQTIIVQYPDSRGGFYRDKFTVPFVFVPHGATVEVRDGNLQINLRKATGSEVLIVDKVLLPADTAAPSKAFTVAAECAANGEIAMTIQPGSIAYSIAVTLQKNGRELVAKVSHEETSTDDRCQTITMVNQNQILPLPFAANPSGVRVESKGTAVVMTVSCPGTREGEETEPRFVIPYAS
eukprot:m51a1_g3870 hypothetical protein (599) ;mRNA; r:432116-434371